jgi:hypothetical protein
MTDYNFILNKRTISVNGARLGVSPSRLIPPVRHFVLLMYHGSCVKFETVELTDINFVWPPFINKGTSVVHDMKYLCVFTPPSFKGVILEFSRRIGVLRRKMELPLTVFHNASVSQN